MTISLITAENIDRPGKFAAFSAGRVESGDNHRSPDMRNNNARLPAELFVLFCRNARLSHPDYALPYQTWIFFRR